MMSPNKWADVQRHWVNILFRHHPILRQAYDLSMELRSIFNRHIPKSDAVKMMGAWYDKVMRLGNDNFRTVIKTFKKTRRQSSTTSSAMQRMRPLRLSTQKLRFSEAR